MQKLTVKQRRFVEAYSGNATEAARLAGYKGNDVTVRQMGTQNLAKPHIASELAKRVTKHLSPLISSRVARQEKMQEWIDDPNASEAAKLKALEMLCKSNGDFIERKILMGADGETLPAPQIIVIKGGKD